MTWSSLTRSHWFWYTSLLFKVFHGLAGFILERFPTLSPEWRKLDLPLQHSLPVQHHSEWSRCAWSLRRDEPKLLAVLRYSQSARLDGVCQRRALEKFHGSRCLKA